MHTPYSKIDPRQANLDRNDQSLSGSTFFKIPPHALFTNNSQNVPRQTQKGAIPFNLQMHRVSNNDDSRSPKRNKKITQRKWNSQKSKRLSPDQSSPRYMRNSKQNDPKIHLQKEKYNQSNPLQEKNIISKKQAINIMNNKNQSIIFYNNCLQKASDIDHMKLAILENHQNTLRDNMRLNLMQNQKLITDDPLDPNQFYHLITNLRKNPIKPKNSQPQIIHSERAQIKPNFINGFIDDLAREPMEPSQLLRLMKVKRNNHPNPQFQAKNMVEHSSQIIRGPSQTYLNKRNLIY